MIMNGGGASLPPRGESLTCGACGLRSFAPVVIKCVKLKGEKTERIRCANTAACAKRVKVTEKREQRRTGT